ncbi:hypothetical protein, partial [Thermogutta sp.]|uniref:hypothetical protein n=1 Tax=Thermogutta sp. TaxID=1962930 RepID=UPI0032208C31
MMRSTKIFHGDSSQPLTFRSFQEAVRWLLREGYRVRLRPDDVVEVWHALPGGKWVSQDILDALKPHYRELKRRLKKPRGWPRGVELPRWWSDVVLGFKIVRARASDCSDCGFPALVLVDFDIWNEWRCPKCRT